MTADVSGSCLENLVSFMYSGTLHLTPATVNVTLEVATQLQISSVIELCQSFLESPHDARRKKCAGFNFGDKAQDHEVEETVDTHEPVVKVERENVADVQVGPPAASTRTTRSASRRMQSGESIRSSPMTKSSSREETENSSGNRKRRGSTESDKECSPAKRSFPKLGSCSNVDIDPEWNPAADGESGSPVYRFSRRRHSYPTIRNPVSSSNGSIQKVRKKRLSSSFSNRTRPLPTAGKQTSATTKQQNLTSTPVYCLQSWQQSRRVLLAARVFLAKQINAICDKDSLCCKQCDVRGFRSRSHLDAHILCRHRKRRFCFSCGRRLASFVALMRHGRSKHRHFPCERSLLSPYRNISVKSQSGAVPAYNKCGWCGEKCASRSELLAHRERVHRKRADVASTAATCRRVVRRWTCSERDCGVSFKHKHELCSHMADQHPTIIFSCPECRFETQVEHILRRYCSHFLCCLVSFVYLVNIVSEH